MTRARMMLATIDEWLDRAILWVDRVLFASPVRMTEWTCLFVMLAWFDELRAHPEIVDRAVYASFKVPGPEWWSLGAGAIVLAHLGAMLAPNRIADWLRPAALAASAFYLFTLTLGFASADIPTTATRVYLALGFAAAYSTIRSLATR